MARKQLRRWIPTAAKVKQMPALQFLGTLIHDPNLFHLNRHSVSVAVFIGVFVAFLPILGQMPLAALLALVMRANLPISVVLCWITNPVTIPPMFYITYEIGRWILQLPPLEFKMELSWEWFAGEFLHIWKPLLLGSVLTGIVLACFGYLTMQAYWYWHVMHNWEKRKKKRWESKQRESET
jgi:hypothetical protein